MRPPEVTDADVIEAGQQIKRAGQRVSGYALRKVIGRGAPGRLMGIWDVHTSGQVDPGAAGICQDLPDEVELALAQVVRAQAESARGMAKALLSTVNARAAQQICERDEMIHTLSVEHAKEIELLLQASRAKDAHISEQATELQRLTAQLADIRSRQEMLERENQSLMLTKANHSGESAALADAQARVAALQGELAQLILTNNAVCDQSNERKVLLATADEKIRGLTSRVADLIQTNDAQRVEINRSHQMVKTLEMHGSRMQARLDQLEVRPHSQGAVANA